MKVIFFLIVGLIGIAAYANGPYADRDIYQVGIRQSVATTPKLVADAVAKATFHVNTSSNCSVEARLFGIREGSSYPSTVFGEPILLGMEFQIWIEGMDEICGSDRKCPPGGVIHYCTTSNEQKAALKETLAKTWESNPIFKVVVTHIVPVPGVRVGN